jgi:hypothetical protein
VRENGYKLKMTFALFLVDLSTCRGRFVGHTWTVHDLISWTVQDLVVRTVHGQGLDGPGSDGPGPSRQFLNLYLFFLNQKFK